MHGGATPKGIASPQTMSGRYSKYLPTRLIDRYEQARSDSALLTLRDDIGLLDTRIGQVVTALDTGESREAWVALLAGWTRLEEQFQALLDTGETPEDMEQTVTSVGTLIRHGLSEGYVWTEIRGLLKERAELVANERKRLVEMQQVMTAEQAMTLMAAVADTVRRNVHDRDALAAISDDLNRLVALEPRAADSLARTG
jgi:hypothetical protein